MTEVVASRRARGRARAATPPPLLADLYQTSRGRHTWVAGHYHNLVHFHNNVLLNTLCPGGRGVFASVL